MSTHACTVNYLHGTPTWSMIIVTTLVLTAMASKSFDYDYSFPLLPTKSLECKIDYSECIGRGFYGQVYKAKCGQLPCAAKLFNKDEKRNFEKYCQLLSTISHPNIVQYLSTDPQSPILMELMDKNLTKFLERWSGPLPYHSQLNICHDVALALAYLHSHDIIHGNLSSNNVLLVGEGSRAKVTDLEMPWHDDVTSQQRTILGQRNTRSSCCFMPAVCSMSSKLDCFSHGVLTLQIITRNFPNPRNDKKDPTQYPSERVQKDLLETERRKEDLDLVKPTHPLLPTVLQCLKDRDTDRPSANELCGRLASLKRESRHAHGVEQTRGHVQRPQEECKLLEGAAAGLMNMFEEMSIGEDKQFRREIRKKDGELERAAVYIRDNQLANKEVRKKDSKLDGATAVGKSKPTRVDYDEELLDSWIVTKLQQTSKKGLNGRVDEEFQWINGVVNQGSVKKKIGLEFSRKDKMVLADWVHPKSQPSIKSARPLEEFMQMNILRKRCPSSPYGVQSHIPDPEKTS